MPFNTKVTCPHARPKLEPSHISKIVSGTSSAISK